ncbi:hypothetical protein BKA67DRAFT_679482 [Truncatella angustata]|uniref:Uncharacterized protein n=1 Tax=Truncatella angustata TaxID=152316 RepID=A0A9P8UJY4_9PEZI|nr:uncharacterized protein BKA67DRAFT_679482 [Truncatella angustata]KAH6653620.1 hypothetical protein BKA67DRAFT_679482 [Truncatella angustata]
MATPTHRPIASHLLMVPMSAHHLVIQDFAGHLYHYQAYMKEVQDNNTRLQQVIDQLNKKIDEMFACQQNRERVIEAQRERIRFLESAQAALSPLELTPTEYVSTYNTELQMSCNTTPSHAPAVETLKEDGFYEQSLLALVESYGNTEEVIAKSSKRTAANELEGEAERQTDGESANSGVEDVPRPRTETSRTCFMPNAFQSCSVWNLYSEFSSAGATSFPFHVHDHELLRSFEHHDGRQWGCAEGISGSSFTWTGLLWVERYYPVDWFTNGKIDDEKYFEVASMTDKRKERILWLGCRLASRRRGLVYNKESHHFAVLSTFEKDISSLSKDKVLMM